MTFEKKNKQRLPEPPRWITKILRSYCHDEYLDEIEGDLFELYRRRRSKYSSLGASFLYAFNILSFLRMYNFKGFSSRYNHNTVMISNYLKVTRRSFVRNKVTSSITLTGLVIGISTFLLLGLYVYDEMSYDDFHPDSKNTYRLYSEYNGQDGQERGGWVTAGFAQEVKNKIPEVENVLRTSMYGTREELFQANDQIYYETGGFEADQLFFEFFAFKLLKGNSKSALKDKNGIILTEKLATKFFGHIDVLGEEVTLNNSSRHIVTGIIEDPPYNTFFNFRYIVPYSDQERPWESTSETYVHLYDKANRSDLENKLAVLVESLPEIKNRTVGIIQLQDVYLEAGFDHSQNRLGSIFYVYIFSSIGALVLFLAFINYTNITTAIYIKRSFEMGIRKIVGARRIQLVFQLFTETFMYIFFAFIIAMLGVYLLLPYYNSFLDRSLTFEFIDLRVIGLLLCSLVVFTFFAGIYPASFLSRFNPSKAVKKQLRTSAGSKTRKTLVIFQFLVTQVLLVVAIVVQNQVEYVQTKNLGFEKEQMLVLPLKGTAKKNNSALKTELLKISGVEHGSVSFAVPGKNGMISWYGNTEIDSFDEDSTGLIFDYLLVDEDFFKTYDLKLNQGRLLSNKFEEDSLKYILINEIALKGLGWVEPLGKKIGGGKVVGVIENFHNESLLTEIRPMIIGISHKERNANYISLKLSTTEIQDTMWQLEEVWDDFGLDYPFDYYFQDDYFDNMYKSERRLGLIITGFTVLAAIIGLMGLIGLAIFMTKQRTNEIGVRKTFGASILNIFSMITWDFMKLIALSIVLAIPISFYIIQRWLENFAYRITPGWELLLLSSVITIGLALLAISYQSIKAAIVNPSYSLRHE